MLQSTIPPVDSDGFQVHHDHQSHTRRATFRATDSCIKHVITQSELALDHHLTDGVLG